MSACHCVTSLEDGWKTQVCPQYKVNTPKQSRASIGDWSNIQYDILACHLWRQWLTNASHTVPQVQSTSTNLYHWVEKNVDTGMSKWSKCITTLGACCEMATHFYYVLQGLTFAQYVVEPFFPDCEKPKMAINLLAVVSISKIYYYQIIQCLKNKNNNMLTALLWKFSRLQRSN